MNKLSFDFNKNGLNRLVKLKEDKIDLDPNSTELLSYGGGPGSVLGIGKTRIRRTSNTTGINPYGNPEGGFKSVSFNKVNNSKSSLDLSNLLGVSYDYFTYSEISGLEVPDPDDELLGINSGDGTQLKRFGPQDNNKTLSTLEDSNALITSSKDISQIKVAEAKTYFNDNSPSGSISDVTYGTAADNKVVTLKSAYKKPDGNDLTYTTKGENDQAVKEYKANPNFTRYRYGNLDNEGNYNNDKFNRKKF